MMTDQWGSADIVAYLLTIDEVERADVKHDHGELPEIYVTIVWRVGVWYNVKNNRLVGIRREIEKHISAFVRLHLLTQPR